MFINQDANLHELPDKILYYPFSGRDIHQPIQLFRDYICEFWFVDICYPNCLPGRRYYTRDLQDMIFIGEDVIGPPDKCNKHTQNENNHSSFYIKPIILIHKYIYKNREIKIIFRRDIDYTALFGHSPFTASKNRIGIFFFRGTSNEGGSDQ